MFELLCLQDQYGWSDADWKAWHSGYWSSWGYDQSWGQSWQASHNWQAGRRQANAETSPHAAAVANLLSRGHTIDRLSSEDLAEIVKHIDQVRAEKTTPMKPSPGDPAAASNSASPGKNKRKTPSASKRSDDDQADKEEKKIKTNHEAKTDEDASKPHEVADEDQKKKELKKRLHARYMRFSRSLVSG